jgi:hypothetical protein
MLLAQHCVKRDWPPARMLFTELYDPCSQFWDLLRLGEPAEHAIDLRIRERRCCGTG